MRPGPTHQIHESRPYSAGRCPAWCDMATCGNRIKNRGLRQRHRSPDAAGGGLSPMAHAARSSQIPVAAQRAGIADRRLVQRFHPAAPGVFDQQNPLALTQRRHDPAGEPEHGGLNGGAVAHHQRPAALGQPLHHLPKR